MGDKKLRLAIAGVGNCASSLVQGIEFYKDAAARGPAAHPCEQGATIASVLMDLGTQQMLLADGNPCSAPYRQLDYREFLAKPSRAAEPAR